MVHVFNYDTTVWKVQQGISLTREDEAQLFFFLEAANRGLTKGIARCILAQYLWKSA